MYLDLVKLKPISITRNGVEEAVLINPTLFKFKKVPQLSNGKPRDIMKAKFVGMYKNRRNWRGKSNSEVANGLRERAWYGS